MTDFVVSAPAKINLGLKVLPKRADGFHGIESIFETVSLCDELRITITDKKNTCTVSCDSMVLPEKNTLSQTYNSFKSIAGIDVPGVCVSIKKKIPSGGGLGGGSSDAASFLNALDMLCMTKLSDDERAEIAGQVGSDVFFFLNCDRGQEAAVVTGRGEFVTAIPKRKDLHYVMIFPGVHSSTKEAYALIDEFYESGKMLDYPELQELEAIYRLSPDKWNFVNTFTHVISRRYPIIERALFDLKNNGALFTDMTGSGSTVFGVFDSKKNAESAAKALSESWNVCSCF